MHRIDSFLYVCMQLEGMHEENGTVRIGQFVNGFGAAQLQQYYGF